MNWYYEHGGSQVGPVDLDDLQALVRSGTVKSETLVWREGWASWRRADEVADLFTPPPLLPQQPMPHIDNHLTKAILVTIFCCAPFGIVAIVKAAQVNQFVQARDFESALRLSREANTWSNWSLGLGLVVGVIYFFVTMIGALAE